MKTHLNPPTLPRNPAFSQVVTVEAPARTIYVGGQNAVTTDDEIVGDNLSDQTRQTVRNLQAALEAADATFADLVQLTITLVDGHSLLDGFAAFQELWDPEAEPPTINVQVVAGLAHPQFLVEISAIAVR
jgi:enamine deaminase RidA (YjgF/YER057c/UK114 family)